MDLAHPIIDPHRHLGGSVPTSFVWETVRKLGLKHLAETREDVEEQMTFKQREPPGFHRFLSKFRILDEIPWTEDLIDDSIRAICQALEAEGIDHTWMDFSINKYMNIGWHKKEAIKFIKDAFDRHRPQGVSLVLSLKYEALRTSSRQYAKLIEDPDVADWLLGLDLVGDEALYVADEWQSLLRHWVEAKKMVRAHVGEYGPVDNVRSAILNLGVTNVAHGLQIVSDPELMAMARDRGITFDLGLSSNLFTGVVSEADWYGQKHPICAMVANRLWVTLGTDDPVICGTTLEREYWAAAAQVGSFAAVAKMQARAVENFLRYPHPSILVLDEELRASPSDP